MPDRPCYLLLPINVLLHYCLRYQLKSLSRSGTVMLTVSRFLFRMIPMCMVSPASYDRMILTRCD